MPTCVEKLPHSCGSSTGLQVFADDDGGVNGYCFSCDTYIDNPYGEPVEAKDIKIKVKTPEEVKEEINEISQLISMPLDSRKLTLKGMEYYGVKTGLSVYDGKTPNILFFPYYKGSELVGYKAELINKKKGYGRWSVGNIKGCDLFGWKQAIATGSRRLYITEGEKDAISLKQVLERKSRVEYRGKSAVVSLPTGAAGAKDVISRMSKEITSRFKEVVLVFDSDDAGERAVEDVTTVLGTALVAKLPCNDPNECLMEGKVDALYSACVFNATTPKNSRIIFGESLHVKAREKAALGELTWPWESMNKRTRNIRIGETIYIGAGVKMGKSELVNSLVAHFIQKDNIKVFVAKPEEANNKTYKMIAGKIAGKFFHDPNREFDYEAYDRAGEVMKGKLALINLYQHLEWDNLKQDIICSVNWGAKAVFIDPITNLTGGLSSGDANTKLQEISQEISAMAMDLGFVAFLFCHLKAPDGSIRESDREKLYERGKFFGLGGCPHERGGSIYSTQFSGSRAMMRSCNYMFGLEGNKDEGLSESIRNQRNLKLLEDREFGEVGSTNLYWDKETGLFSEVEENGQ